MSEVSSKLSWYRPDAAADAISFARENNHATLILVEDPDENNFENVLSDSKIVLFLKEKFSCLRLPKGDQVTDQFIDLVPVEKFPSIFIFYGGKLRETVRNTGISPDELLACLEAVFDSSKKASIIEALPSASEKKALLLERIEEKRRLKAQQEKESLKLKELERRQSTKQLQEAILLKQEREAKLLQETKIREKREAAEHRLKVQAQISQDKAERAALRQRKPPNDSKTRSFGSNSEGAPSSSHNTCRLNLIMEDGSQHRTSFDADVSLQEVRDYITNRLLTEDVPFDIMLTIPRYRFTSQDNARSLRNLNLGSTNSLLIKVIKPTSLGATASNMAFSLVNWGVTSIQNLVMYLSTLVYPTRQNNIASSSASQDRPSSNTRQNGVNTIHTKRPSDDKSEPRTTDNGNSTQQE